MNKAAKKTATLTAVDIGSAKIKVLIADNLEMVHCLCADLAKRPLTVCVRAWL